MTNDVESKNREVLFTLLKEHPDLPVIPMVDSDVVCGDYGYWLGCWGSAKIDEYVEGDERIYFKGECDEDEVLDGFAEYRSEWEDWTDDKITEVYNNLPWIKCIVVYITV